MTGLLALVQLNVLVALVQLHAPLSVSEDDAVRLHFNESLCG